MTNEITNVVFEVMPHFEGYVYPNEATAQPLWSVLIVLYPYITGLVAGAFIMASLVRVFKVKALEPVYRLSLLTAFAFLLCAPLPLLFHLGHPERCFEVMMTPHLTSPMAIFGFVYAWYLMAVLLLELWFDYRQDFVEWSQRETGFRGVLYRAFTLGVTDESEQTVALDDQSQPVVGQSAHADHFHPVGHGVGHRAVRVQLYGAALDPAPETGHALP
jgi:predicted membrane protein